MLEYGTEEEDQQQERDEAAAASGKQRRDHKQAYDVFIRENPETKLPRVVGCYQLEHSGLRLKE